MEVWLFNCVFVFYYCSSFFFFFFLSSKLVRFNARRWHSIDWMRLIMKPQTVCLFLMSSSRPEVEKPGLIIITEICRRNRTGPDCILPLMSVFHGEWDEACWESTIYSSDGLSRWTNRCIVIICSDNITVKWLIMLFQGIYYSDVYLLVL